MRAQIRSIILNILGSISKPSCHIYILNGHYVKLKESETNALQFESLLSELSTDFDFISFDIACLKIINHEAVARPTIAFTFDDGFKECYTVIAPILEKFATNACFFIDPCVIGTTDNVRREFLRTRLMIYRDKKFMSWNEIADLQKRGHEIGNHTMNHTALTGMSYEENLTEILTGKYELEKQLGFDCKYFAVPYGAGPRYFDDNGIKAVLASHSISFASYQSTNYFF